MTRSRRPTRQREEDKDDDDDGTRTIVSQRWYEVMKRKDEDSEGESNPAWRT
jgi:hypothetical protein